jgi:hypothetical protein
MIQKVVYIGYQPLTEKVIEDFYFNQLLENKFSVEYWDLSSIYFSKKIEVKVKKEYILFLNSIKQVENEIKIQDLKTTLFISQMTFEYRVLNLHKLFTKYNCITGFFARGASPHFSNNSLKTNRLSRIKKIVNINSLFNYLGNFYCVFLKKHGLLSFYSVVFRAGERGTTTIGRGFWYDEKKSKIIDVNSFDFENYISSKNNDRIIENKYCLYLDEYLPFHPDFDLLNINTIEPNNFYTTLNRFFDKLESEHGIEVVIAAHPKADKYKSHNYFNDRKVLFNKTSTLSRDAEFILAHNSSSINFAVLNQKPVISILTNDIIKEMNMYSIYIKLVSISTGSNLINIDDNSIIDLEIPIVDDKKYNDFKYFILTSEKSENLISSEIYIETLKKIKF